MPFSSDSVPIHLVTREAFTIYARHLAKDGVLVANVSNRYLAVDRVVLASARSQGFSVALIDTPSEPARHVAHVEWAVVARDPKSLSALVGSVKTLPLPSPVLWTDVHSSVLDVLRTR